MLELSLLVTIGIVLTRLASLLTFFMSILTVLISLLTGCKSTTLLEVEYPTYKKITHLQPIRRLISTIWRLVSLVITALAIRSKVSHSTY